MIKILSKVRVLYIEDNQAIRDALSRGLRKRVKELEIAVDGIDGFDKYLSFKPDVIITDIKMPNMSGLDMSKKIRETDKKTPILITSAHGESDILIEAIEVGVTGYIIKPINQNKLYETIITYAQSKILEDEVKKQDKILVNQAQEVALGELIRNISHQWRQPLSIISTLTTTINLKNELGELDDKFLKKSLDTIEKTAISLSQTIDLFYKSSSKIDMGKANFNIYNSIDIVLESLSEKILDLNINIILDVDSNLEVYSNKNLILTALENIILNSTDALKCITEDKYIFINIKKDDILLYIEVTDNAGGIDDDIIHKIFQPYFTTYHQSQGKGLGLYSVKLMIENSLNGTIEVFNKEFIYNQNSYKGASFKIKLNSEENNYETNFIN